MKLKKGIIGLAMALLFVGGAHANTLRVVVVQTSDVSGYVKAIEDGQALLKKKGSPVQLRVWMARFAGSDAGSVVVSAEYPNLEALAKDVALMSNDADLSAWLASLGKMRKIVSDSIYEELKR